MIYNHPKYIKQTIPKGLDHARVTENNFYYVNPPKYTEDVEEWGNNISEVAETKIIELLERFDLVEERYKHNVELIRENYSHFPKEDFTLEFFLTFEAHEATEITHLKKWLSYWKRVYEDVVEEKLIEQDFEDEKFTDHQLDLAREKPIEEMYDGDLKPNYGKLIGLCPFHKERTPSFTIYVNENKFHCFGCQEHGDAIDFYMKTHNVDFVQAIKDLI